MFPKLNDEESLLLYSLSKQRKIDVFIGGMQLLRESREMFTFLEMNSKKDADSLKKIADLLVKCRFEISDSSEIVKIINLPNPVLFLEALYTLLTAYSMLTSVGDSVTRASEVVQNIRAFIKKDVSNGSNRKEIKLKENIKVVLNIFSYEFKRDIDLLIEIDDSLTVKGFDVKLFQLWSNLIKNAVDAMENTDNKKLIIKGNQLNDKVIISFSNNGPMIPADIQGHIFRKFFSTKKEKNGTGLGLSIVQNVIQEHNAKIHLESNEELTTFTVEFSTANHNEI
jgi:signal transduction histidine kinase